MIRATIREILEQNGGVFANMESDLKARQSETRRAPDPDQALWERLNKEYPHWRITQEIGTGIWYRECVSCGSITMWRNLSSVPVADDCSSCAIPFEGEPISRPF